MNRPAAWEIYKHFKGKYYEIICIAKDSETEIEKVVYKALYEPYEIYVRDLEEFLSPVDKVKYPSATQEMRFMRIMPGGDTKADIACGFDNKTKNISAGNDTGNKTKADFVNNYTENIMNDISCVNDDNDNESIADGNTAGNTSAVPDADHSGISPALLKFLDTEGFEAQLECLTEIKPMLTPEILTPIEFSVGMEEAQTGSVDERYRGIKNYIILKQKYERQHR